VKASSNGPQKTTIVFPLDDNERVLLGMKKRGFGAGWWNGFGGKLEAGETYKLGAIRETHEECGLQIKSLQLAARLLFYFDNNLDVVSAVYTSNSYSGDPVETEEMRPEWFSVHGLPLEQMWGGDRYWAPSVLDRSNDAVLDFVVYFDKNQNYLSSREAHEGELDSLFDWEPEK